jgi:hypothetical protein
VRLADWEIGDTAGLEACATRTYGHNSMIGLRLGPGPGGTNENSPAFQRRVEAVAEISPDGTVENVGVGRPFGTSPNNSRLRGRSAGFRAGLALPAPAGVGKWPLAAQVRRKPAWRPAPRSGGSSNPKGIEFQGLRWGG